MSNNRRRSDIADIMRSVLVASAAPAQGSDPPAHDMRVVHVLHAIGRAFGISPGYGDTPIGTVYAERCYRNDHIKNAVAGVRAAAGAEADPIWDNTIGVLLQALGLTDSPAAGSALPPADPPRRYRQPAPPTIDTYRIEGAEAGDLVARLGRYGFRAAAQPAEGGGACVQLANIGDRAEWADRLIGQWAEAAGATVRGQVPAARQPRRRRYE